MATYFVYRSDQLRQPTWLHVRRFDDATVLDWFRRHWVGIADYVSAEEYVERLIGVEVDAFAEVFQTIADRQLPLPETIADVRAVLQASEQGIIRTKAHCVQVLVEDRHDAVYYLFDDEFVQAHPDLTAYVLHEWCLPNGAGQPGWKSDQKAIETRKPTMRREGEGRTYAIMQASYDDHFYANLRPSCVERIDGLRVPELCRLLMTLSEEDAEWNFNYPPRQLRKALMTAGLGDGPEEEAFLAALREAPDDEVTWRAYADWLMERGQSRPGMRLLDLGMRSLRGLNAGDPARNVVQAGEHVAQVCIHTGAASFDQWFVFDDLWGAAYPALANSLLRYCTRWDMLSTRKKDAGST